MNGNKPMRLAYRIASTVPMLPGDVGYEPFVQRAQAEALTIATARKFCFSNVAEFYAGHDRFEWDPCEDVPNWAPPFKVLFAEWVIPRFWNMGGWREEKSDGGAQEGVLSFSLDVTDDNRHLLDHWRLLMGVTAGSRSPLQIEDAILRPILQETRWLSCGSLWLSSGVKPILGRPLWAGLNFFLFISAHGRLLKRLMTGANQRFIADCQGDGGAGEAALWGSLNIFGLGLSFCHCKNVRRVELADDRGGRWHRRTGVPVDRYYTLDIDPMREVLRSEGGSEQSGLQRALHICRGHFAHYTPEHPLFGKYVGTFWRPDHVRGSADHGTVRKDYKVSPRIDL
jgi:hypothetical protein